MTKKKKVMAFRMMTKEEIEADKATKERVLVELLAMMESCKTAKECRHLVKMSLGF
jgi:hypothetical protein